jgi:hypothetical protein
MANIPGINTNEHDWSAAQNPGLTGDPSIHATPVLNYTTNDQIVNDTEMGDYNTNGNEEIRETGDPNYNWITIANKIRRYKAIINVKELNAKTISLKQKAVLEAVGDIENFMGTKLHFYKSEQYIMAEFGSKEAMELACTKTIESENEFKLKSIINRGDDEIKNKTIVVKDLPLSLEKTTLKKILEKKGEDEITDIKTKVTGPWLTAYVTFKKEETVKKLEDVWSIPYLKDLCRMAPAYYS